MADPIWHMPNDFGNVRPDLANAAYFGHTTFYFGHVRPVNIAVEESLNSMERVSRIASFTTKWIART